MIRITIVAVGKLKEKYWKDAISEYSKRLARYCSLNINEVPDEPTPDNASDAMEDMIRFKEGKKILDKIPSGAYRIILDLEGRDVSSEELSNVLEVLPVRGQSHIAFVIGGSLGLSKEVLKEADMRLSFSRLTFPHQLMRVILLEQIYRGFKIICGEPYHK